MTNRNNTVDTWKDFNVTLTIRASTRITFDLTGREGVVITRADVIDNAIGSLPNDFIQNLHDCGWDVALPIEGETT